MVDLTIKQSGYFDARGLKHCKAGLHDSAGAVFRFTGRARCFDAWLGVTR